MPYFLDGNNLIGITRRTRRPGEDDRSALLTEVMDRLRANRSEVRIFFDGPQARPISLGRLRVICDGGSADEAILRALSASKDPGQIIVVTADRGLASRTRDAGARAISPSDFWGRFGGPEAPPARAAAESPVNVEEWLDYFADPKNRGR